MYHVAEVRCVLHRTGELAVQQGARAREVEAAYVSTAGGAVAAAVDNFVMKARRAHLKVLGISSIFPAVLTLASRDRYFLTRL